ncbi:hypothetical protein EJB05_39234 [Eragrostis curvula]|uniref:F-box domain-containing protein n=1 Tax=Eragrostis curvula TaxID=38414 RepID=A0A5J9TWY9_9POAL|nr:hypothetical protein EJB05_39234 [Eragrostis curvula]
MPSRRPGGRQRSRRSHRRKAEERDWADGLPMDALLAILGRLDHIDVLMAAELVSRSWRRAARDEPTLWRRITMRGHEGIATKLNRCGMACEAVRRSARRCEAFCGEFAGDDGFLIYLSEQAPCLKSLRLISCDGVTDVGLIEAVKELTLLEELEISLCDNVGDSTEYETLGDVCPQLKHFIQRKSHFNVRDSNYAKDIRAIASMRGLRSVQLFGYPLDNEDLEIILDNCLNLESLDIRHCFNVEMDETLLAKCNRIKILKLPDDPTDDCDFQFGSPLRTYVARTWSCCSCCFFRHSDSDDDNDSDFYREPSRYEEDLDKYDRVLPYSMRTFLK